MEHFLNTIDLNLIRTFHIVVKKGSLTQAANYLNCPKSKVSRDLTKLETLLKSNLINRSPRGVQVTSTGEKLISETADALAGLNFGLAQFQNSDSEKLIGDITLTAPEDFSIEVLPQIIGHFYGLYPGIKIHLFTTNDKLSFDRYNIDLALRVGKLQDSDLIQKKVGDIHLIKVKARRFEHKECILGHLFDFEGKSLLENHENRDKNQSVLKSNSFLYLKNLALNTPIEVTLPRFICERELSHSDFIEVSSPPNFTPKPLYLLSRSHKYIPEHVKILKKIIEVELKKILS